MSERNRLSRRDLLKLLPAAGVAAGAAALLGRTAHAARFSSGVCRLCMGHCGIRATIRDDRVVRMEGDPASVTGGFICMHGLALREIIHSPDRVRRPLKKNGESHEEISWERALGEIAERLHAVKDEFGAEALMVQMGWGLVAHPIQGFLIRFCQAFGTPNLAAVDSLCQAALRTGQALVAGAMIRADANRSRTVVLWGAHPEVSTPSWERVVSSVIPTGSNLVVIDPVRTSFAADATLHLQIRPGTDGALAMGLMHVIVEEGLQNQSYIDRFTLGFDRLRERIGRFDPRRVSEITSLRAEEIRRAARMIANEGPSSIWPGLGVEHHANCTQTIRAITVLSALCGDIDVPGGNHLLTRPKSRRVGKPLPALTRMFTPQPVPPPVHALPLGHDEFPLFEMYNRQAQGNLLARAILEDEPYPVRALIQFGSNSMVTGPGNERMRRAAGKLSLLVSVDPFLTESGRLADYVLPAATFAEGPRPPEGRRVVNSPMIEARHESRSDWDIIRGLAAALGLERYFPWPTLEEAMSAPHDQYMLSERRLLAEPTPEADGPPRFPTASGKIEIYSEALERFGYDPLPDWTEPAEASRQRGDDFPFILVTGPRARTYINSQFRQVPSVRSKMPRPLAEVHPAAARQAGIADGDLVAVVSPHGRIVLHAKVTTRVHPECVVVPAGWSEANANRLTSAEELDPVTGFPTLRSGVCRLEGHFGFRTD